MDDALDFPILSHEEEIVDDLILPENIGLNLECEDDELYELPITPSPTKQPLPPSVETRLEISFPVQHNDEPERISCSQCEKSFTRESLQKDHLFKTHGIEGLFSCEVCKYIGNTYRLLQKHIAKVHKKKTKDCTRTACGNMVKGRKDKAIELENSEDQWETNDNSVNLPTTKDNKDQTKLKVQCPTCLKTLKTSTYLAIHKRLHNETKIENFLCNVCGKPCVSKSMLTAHEKTHSNERNFICEFKECGVRLKNLSALNFHRKRCHGEKIYVCQESGCRKSYSCESQLKMHAESHKLRSLKNMFKCNSCSKSYTRESALLNHAHKEHGVIGQFRCDKCPYTGNTSYCLKSHRKRFCKFR